MRPVKEKDEGLTGLDAKLNEGTVTQLAIVLSFFFGKEGLSQFPTKLLISVGFIGMFVFTTVINMFTGNWANEHLAIQSRTGKGLVGLLFAPFLHPSPSSAFIDCAPFFLLSMLVMLRPKGIQTFAALVCCNAVLGGMVVWFLGRADTHHTGCGAMIFTLFGYLLLVGVVKRDLRSSIVSLAVFVMYGGLLWALLPVQDRSLSWEGHLMGMTIGCVLGAYDGRSGPIGEETTTATAGASTKTVKAGEVTERTGLTAKEEDDTV